MGQRWAPAYKRWLRAVAARHRRELVVVAVLALSLCVLWGLLKPSTASGSAVQRSSLRLGLNPQPTAAAKQQSWTWSWSNKTLTCAEQAAAAEPTNQEVSALLGHKLRPLPATDSSRPVLAASNWEGLANKEHAELPRGKLADACGHHLFRYRVVSGVVYADHEHSSNTILAWHRDVFLEMLLMSVWLYKSFPDVDIWVAFTDEPSRCRLDIPVLQYTVIGLDTVQQAQNSSSAVLKDGSTASITQLLTGGGEPARIEDPAPKFYRGWAFNYPFSWQQLSYLPSTLLRYQHCLQDKVGGKPSKAKIIWRGSNTGGRRGWAPALGSSPLLHGPWGAALANKRMSLALLARSHSDWMDVGLHEVIPELMGPAGEDTQFLKEIKHLMIRSYVPQEEWGSYALQLSIDGHGSPNRLPLQYLQGSSVILKVMSPYKDAFEELFEPGVHFEPVRYDLADMLPCGHELLAKFKSGGQNQTEMLRMAAAASSKALDVFNLLGQLDALAYAVLKVKSVCKWDVQPPPLRVSEGAAAAAAPGSVPGVSAESEWEVLKLQRSRDGSKWSSPSLRAGWALSIRESMLQELSQNFS